jgi:hypothetical protein
MVPAKAVAAFACVVVLSTAYVVLPERSYAQATSRTSLCDGYARDFARRHSRGPIFGGAAFGAVGGAIIGGIIAGPVGTAAAIGASTGGIIGGGARVTRFNTLYTRAYSDCMSA